MGLNLINKLDSALQQAVRFSTHCVIRINSIKERKEIKKNSLKKISPVERDNSVLDIKEDK